MKFLKVLGVAIFVSGIVIATWKALAISKNEQRTVIGKTTYYGETPPRITVYYSDGTKEVIK
jgi:hypothetical protein